MSSHILFYLSPPHLDDAGIITLFPETLMKQSTSPKLEHGGALSEV